MKLKPILLTISVIAVSVVIVGYLSTILWKPGFIYHTDVTEKIDIDQLYERYIYTYSNDLGEALPEKARIPLFYFIFGVFKLAELFLRVDYTYYLKIKLILTVLLTFLSFVFFIKPLLRNAFSSTSTSDSSKDTSLLVLISVIAGGLYYTFNFWAANRLIHFNLFFSTVAIPISFGLFYRYLFGDKKNRAYILLILAFLLALFTPTPHTVLFEFLIFSVLFIIYLIFSTDMLRAKISVFLWCSLFAVMFVLLNSYWVLPYLSSFSTPDAILSEYMVRLFAKRAFIWNSVRLMGFWVEDSNKYYLLKPLMLSQVLTWVPFALFFIGVLGTSLLTWKSRSRNYLALALTALFVLGTFLASSTVLTHAVYFYLMFHSPIKSFGWIFREYDKFGIIIAFVYSLGISLSFMLLGRLRGLFRILATVSLTLLFSITLLLNFAYFDQVLRFGYNPEPLPNEFNHVRDYMIGESATPSNSLWYPGVASPYWSRHIEVDYTFANLISPIPTVTTRSDIKNFVTRYFQEGNFNSVDIADVLRVVGVKYFILRSDSSAFGVNELKDKMINQKSLEEQLSTTHLTVYENSKFDGLVGFCDKRILTNAGFGVFTNKLLVEALNKGVCLDFTDKPSQIESSKLPTFYYLSGPGALDAAINTYKSRFIYPYDYVSKKDTGVPGFWGLGSLENLTHAETDFLFGLMGISNVQLDYGKGVAISKEGWEFKDPGLFKPKPEVLKLSFSAHANVSMQDIGASQRLTYVSVPKDFVFYWNIIKSDKLDVHGKSALKLDLRAFINKELQPHFKMTFFDPDERIISTEHIGIDSDGFVERILKVPNGSTKAELSVWTVSGGDTYSYEVAGIQLRDVSNFVDYPTLLVPVKEKCTQDCHLYVRVLKSPSGGKVSLLVNKSDFVIETRVPSEKTRFEWVDVGLVASDDVISRVRIQNLTGFNVLNALVFLSSDDVKSLNNDISAILSSKDLILTTDTNKEKDPFLPANRPVVSVEELSPVKYKVTVSGSSGVSGILTFAKPYSRNWVLKPNNTTAAVINGVINGWYVQNLQDGVYYVEYRPQDYFILGVVVSGVTLLVTAVLVGVLLRRKES